MISFPGRKFHVRRIRDSKALSLYTEKVQTRNIHPLLDSLDDFCDTPLFTHVSFCEGLFLSGRHGKFLNSQRKCSELCYLKVI